MLGWGYFCSSFQLLYFLRNPSLAALSDCSKHRSWLQSQFLQGTDNILADSLTHPNQIQRPWVPDLRFNFNGLNSLEPFVADGVRMDQRSPLPDFSGGGGAATIPFFSRSGILGALQSL